MEQITDTPSEAAAAAALSEEPGGEAVKINSKRFIIQPGSTVATSLSEGEAKQKHVILLEVEHNLYRTVKYPLETVRPFAFESVCLRDMSQLDTAARIQKHHQKRIREQIQKQQGQEQGQVQTHALDPAPGRAGRGGARGKATKGSFVKDMLQGMGAKAGPKALNPNVMIPIPAPGQQLTADEEQEAITAFLDLKVEGELQRLAADHPNNDLLPMVRLRVDYSSFSTINSQRFGQRFVGRVANPNDMLMWFKARRPTVGDSMGVDASSAGAGGQATDPALLRPEALDQSRIEELVAAHLGGGGMSVVAAEEMSEALHAFVDKDEKNALVDCINRVLDATKTEAAASLLLQNSDLKDLVREEDILGALQESVAKQQMRRIGASAAPVPADVQGGPVSRPVDEIPSDGTSDGVKTKKKANNRRERTLTAASALEAAGFDKDLDLDENLDLDLDRAAVPGTGVSSGRRGATGIRDKDRGKDRAAEEGGSLGREAGANQGDDAPRALRGAAQKRPLPGSVTASDPKFAPAGGRQSLLNRYLTASQSAYGSQLSQGSGIPSESQLTPNVAAAAAGLKPVKTEANGRRRDEDADEDDVISDDQEEVILVGSEDGTADDKALDTPMATNETRTYQRRSGSGSRTRRGSEAAGVTETADQGVGLTSGLRTRGAAAATSSRASNASVAGAVSKQAPGSGSKPSLLSHLTGSQGSTPGAPSSKPVPVAVTAKSMPPPASRNRNQRNDDVFTIASVGLDGERSTGSRRPASTRSAATEAAEATKKRKVVVYDSESQGYVPEADEEDEALQDEDMTSCEEEEEEDSATDESENDDDDDDDDDRGGSGRRRAGAGAKAKRGPAAVPDGDWTSRNKGDGATGRGKAGTTGRR